MHTMSTPGGRTFLITGHGSLPSDDRKTINIAAIGNDYNVSLRLMTYTEHGGCSLVVNQSAAMCDGLTNFQYTPASARRDARMIKVALMQTASEPFVSTGEVPDYNVSALDSDKMDVLHGGIYECRNGGVDQLRLRQ